MACKWEFVRQEETTRLTPRGDTEFVVVTEFIVRDEESGKIFGPYYHEVPKEKYSVSELRSYMDKVAKECEELLYGS